MDATIGIVQSVAITPAQTLPTLPIPAPSGGGSSADPTSQGTVLGNNGQTDFNAKAAEQKRYEAVQQAAQHIANVYVVSDKSFTIFKDATGQYITRYRNLQSGKVTYIPEPQLLKMGGSSAPPVLDVRA